MRNKHIVLQWACPVYPPIKDIKQKYCIQHYDKCSQNSDCGRGTKCCYDGCIFLCRALVYREVQGEKVVPIHLFMRIFKFQFHEFLNNSYSADHYVCRTQILVLLNVLEKIYHCTFKQLSFKSLTNSVINNDEQKLHL